MIRLEHVRIKTEHILNLIKIRIEYFFCFDIRLTLTGIHV